MQKGYYDYLQNKKKTKSFEKFKRRRRLKFNKKRGVYPRINGKLIPVKKYCIQCKVRRVHFHHLFCNYCWKMKNGD